MKAGRTHLMDATPVTVGQEADAWAGLVERALSRSIADLASLGELPLGGTAVGTGINAPAGFAAAVVDSLAAETGFPLRTTPNPMVHQGGQGALGEASSGLRAVAVALTKIANDIRLLASGPAAGLGELRLPELQAGSSIMPGKVNPVLCESVNQVAARVMGNDVTVGYAASQGILELNTYLPVIADALLESATLLGNVAARVRRAVRRRHHRRRGADPRLRRADVGAGDRAQPDHRVRAGGGDREGVARDRAARSSTSSSIEGVLDADEARRVLDPLRAAGITPDSVTRHAASGQCHGSLPRLRGRRTGCEAGTLLLGRRRSGSRMAHDEVDAARFEAGREQGDPSTLADSVQTDRLAGRGRVGAEHADGGQRLAGAVLECLIGPVTWRSAAAGLVVGQDGRADVGHPFRPFASGEPVAVARAVGEHQSGPRLGATGRRRDDRAQVADRGGDHGLGRR